MENGYGEFIADNITIAALAHNYKGAVIEHDFWGTEAVVNALLNLKNGWNEFHTHIKVPYNMIKRDQITGNVIDICC